MKTCYVRVHFDEVLGNGTLLLIVNGFVEFLNETVLLEFGVLAGDLHLSHFLFNRPPEIVSLRGALIVKPLCVKVQSVNNIPTSVILRVPFVLVIHILHLFSIKLHFAYPLGLYYIVKKANLSMFVYITALERRVYREKQFPDSDYFYRTDLHKRLILWVEKTYTKVLYLNPLFDLLVDLLKLICKLQFHVSVSGFIL